MPVLSPYSVDGCSCVVKIVDDCFSDVLVETEFAEVKKLLSACCITKQP